MLAPSLLGELTNLHTEQRRDSEFQLLIRFSARKVIKKNSKWLNFPFNPLLSVVHSCECSPKTEADVVWALKHLHIWAIVMTKQYE